MGGITISTLVLLAKLALAAFQAFGYISQIQERKAGGAEADLKAEQDEQARLSNVSVADAAVDGMPSAYDNNSADRAKHPAPIVPISISTSPATGVLR